jgi:putative addiction module CopG family antidote
MSISLPPELQAYVESRTLAGSYATPEEVVGEAVRRMMVEEARHEAAVVEGLRDEQSPLTQANMDEVRKLARRGREDS